MKRLFKGSGIGIAGFVVLVAAAIGGFKLWTIYREHRAEQRGAA